MQSMSSANFSSKVFARDMAPVAKIERSGIENMEELIAKGVFDELGLLTFETLHEMQIKACDVFSQNELFGTYSEESKQFEWMTFKEFGENVDRIRSLLVDIGEMLHCWILASLL